MCDVCCAGLAMKKGGYRFDWASDPDAPKDVAMFVEMQGRHAEAPGRVRIRRRGTAWSRWFDTHDLASTAGSLGLDVKWRFVGSTTRDYLAGRMPVERLIHLETLSAQRHREWVARTTPLYTVFEKDGSAYLVTSRIKGARRRRMDRRVDVVVRKAVGIA